MLIELVRFYSEEDFTAYREVVHRLGAVMGVGEHKSVSATYGGKQRCVTIKNIYLLQLMSQLLQVDDLIPEMEKAIPFKKIYALLETNPMNNVFQCEFKFLLSLVFSKDIYSSI